jgi:hypothetical protein
MNILVFSLPSTINVDDREAKMAIAQRLYEKRSNCLVNLLS